MKSNPLALLACFLLVCSTLACLPGCQDEDQPRSRVRIVRVMDPAEASDLYAGVFQSDVRDIGSDAVPFTDDDVIYEDELLVTVENEPASSLLSLEPEGPFGAVVLTNYRIEFEIDGESLAPISGNLHLVVPTGQERDASIVAVTAALKAAPPLVSLVQTGGELSGTAHIVMWGYEETSEDEIRAEGSIQIHFADWL